MPDSLFSFSRSYRLTTKADFQSVFKKPYKVSQRFFLGLCQRNAYGHARLGMVVGKRFAKTSVMRNQLKRIIRESFRVNKDNLKGLDIVVLLRSECSALDKKAWRDDVEKIWQWVSVNSARWD